MSYNANGLANYSDQTALELVILDKEPLILAIQDTRWK